MMKVEEFTAKGSNVSALLGSSVESVTRASMIFNPCVNPHRRNVFLKTFNPLD